MVDLSTKRRYGMLAGGAIGLCSAMLMMGTAAAATDTPITDVQTVQSVVEQTSISSVSDVTSTTIDGVAQAITSDTSQPLSASNTILPSTDTPSGASPAVVSLTGDQTSANGEASPTQPQTEPQSLLLVPIEPVTPSTPMIAASVSMSPSVAGHSVQGSMIANWARTTGDYTEPSATTPEPSNPVATPTPAHPTPAAPLESGLLSSLMVAMGLAVAVHQWVVVEIGDATITYLDYARIAVLAALLGVVLMSYAFLLRRSGSVRAARGSTQTIFTLATSLLMSYVAPPMRMQHSSFLVVSDTKRGSH